MPGVHELYVESASERDLKRLAEEDFTRVTRSIKRLARDPRPAGRRKTSGSTNDYRVRIGDLRVIHEVDDDSHAVRIVRIRHRDEAYR